MKSIIKGYDAFLIDLWGVIHDGIQAYPGVVDTINHLMSLEKEVIFLSNSPRPASVAIKHLTAMGIHVLPEHVLTSGDVVREQLIAWDDPVFSLLGKRFYHLDSEKNKDLLANLETEETSHLCDANFVLLSAFMKSSEDLSQYDKFLQEALDLKLPFVCVNPDKLVVHGDSTNYCAGVLGEQYEQMGGTVYYYGKPHTNVYDAVLKRLQTKGLSDKTRMVMIGDTLETDILGANRAGIDSALVQTGNFGRLLASGKSRDQLLKVNDMEPTWIIPSLAMEELMAV